jgi:hypothetical protein
LPRPVGSPVYARVGDVPAAMILAIALLAVIRRRLQPNTSRSEYFAG